MQDPVPNFVTHGVAAQSPLSLFQEKLVALIQHHKARGGYELPEHATALFI
jgi:hypothetical protein